MRAVDADLVDLGAAADSRCAGEVDGFPVLRVAGIYRVLDAVGHVQDHALDAGIEHRDIDARLSTVWAEQTQQVELAVGDRHCERIRLGRIVVDVVRGVGEVAGRLVDRQRAVLRLLGDGVGQGVALGVGGTDVAGDGLPGLHRRGRVVGDRRGLIEQVASHPAQHRPHHWGHGLRCVGSRCQERVQQAGDDGVEESHDSGNGSN